MEQRDIFGAEVLLIDQLQERVVIAKVHPFGLLRVVISLPLAPMISGDNSRTDYNEPQDMKNELVRLGTPAERIYLDYAGFRTYDSVIRLSAIFGQEHFTVISQEFHNQRAVYIAKTLGLDVVGFNAAPVDGINIRIREKFARVKVFLDFLIDKKPKFLGERISIPDQS